MKPLLKIVALEKQYDKNLVFTSLSFNVSEKSIFWIKGINGSGKTTLMKIISSQIEDYKGDISVSYTNLKLPTTPYV